MSEPISAVAKIASTPDQAKVYVAMLQAEGIPAFIDGATLTDEFAMSQRLMNVSNVKVMVPASSLERAKEILTPIVIDEDELEQQALAASDGVETPPPPKPEPTTPPGRIATIVATIAVIAAIAFMMLWITELTRYGEDPLYRQEWKPDGWRTYLRNSDKLVAFRQDANGDGIIEKSVSYSPSDSWITTVDDMDPNGFDRRLTVRRDKDLVVTWTRDDANTPYNRATVTDADGKVYQTIEWQPHSGWLVKKP